MEKPQTCSANISYERLRHFLCSDIDNSGYVSDYELQDLFREASYSLPGYKVREIMNAFTAGDRNKDEKISFEEFVSVSSHLV